MFSGIRDWADRNRYKITGAAVVAAGVAGYLYFNPEHNPFGSETIFTTNASRSGSAVASADSEIAVEDDEWSGSTRTGNEAHRATGSSGTSNKASAQRSRILLRVRKEFAVQAMQFLPLLQTKIIRVVDFDHAYDQLRELKRRRAAAEKSPSGADMASTLDNNQLWEEIKDSSFTYLFVTVYIGAVMCALLRIQLHIQARALGMAAAAAGTGAAASRAPPSGFEDFFDQMDADLLKQLVNSTYTPLFGEGLRGLTSMVREHVTAELRDWPVCDPNVVVEYSQLNHKLSNIRKACEASFPLLLTKMCLLPPSERENPELNESAIQSGSGDGSGSGSAAKSTAAAAAGPDALVASMLAQTWDVVDSPLFNHVCTEAVDTCFKHIYIKLREKVFLPVERADHLSGEASVKLRTPPIASLLPQIKAIAKEMLPAFPVAPASASASATASGSAASPASAAASAKALGGSSNSSSLLTAEVRDIASGPALDALCIAIFDAAPSI